MPPDNNPPDPPRSLSTGEIHSGGGAVSVGGNVYDQRTMVMPLPPAPGAALHSIPAPVGDFAGRAADVAALLRELQPGAGPSGAAAISGVRGLGGIGKTQLACAVAARLTDVFPDAQILLPLHGAGATALTPEAALAFVVHAFAPAVVLPADLDSLRAHYLAHLAGKRALILADDAADAAQVKPLIPPPGCALLVTSRRDFRLPGMRVRKLDTLAPDAAIQLLGSICARIVGTHASRLAELCGYLPLALRVAASLLAVETQRTVDSYLAVLADERLRLAALRDPDDPELNVDASLRLSWTALDETLRAVLAQLSIFAAPFDFAAARAVVHHGDTEARRTEEEETELEGYLGQLLRRSLLEYDAETERYRLHDLVRVFAAARLPAPAAVRWRHARHYAEVTNQARNLYHQGGAALMAGLALFDRERAHIDGAWAWVRAQADTDAAQADPLLLAFADATVYIGDVRYDKQRERIPQLESALAAARRLGDRAAEGRLLNSTGLAYADLGGAPAAIGYYEQALALLQAGGDRRGEGAVLGNLGAAYFRLGDAARAIRYYEQQLALVQALGDQRGEGNALGNLGIAYATLGEPRRAIGCYEQALAIARAGGDRRAEGQALGNLGAAYFSLGDARRAIGYHEQRLALARALGDRHGEGLTLGNLGAAYFSLGDAPQAAGCYEEALAILHATGDRQTAAIHSWNLGLLLVQQGDLARGGALLQVCVDYEQEIGHPAADQDAAQLAQVRARLAGGRRVEGAGGTGPPGAEQ